MNEEKKETIKFQSKFEIAECIKVLTPFADGNEEHKFALEKIKELTKLL